MSIVSVEHVSKDYMLGKTVVPALRDVSLSVDKGEFLSIAGPSAAARPRSSTSSAASTRPRRAAWS
jgi:putative ABC transport system ATP-binding protein